MKLSKSPVTSAAQCGFPGCSKPAPLKCSRCREVHYCSKEHQTTHWRLHKKLCVKPGESISWPAAPAPLAAKAAPPIVTPVAAPGSFAAPAKSAPVQNVEEVDDSDKCIICMDRVVNVKFKACSHSMTCRECTDETIRRGLPCPLCRKPISGYEVGKFIDSRGAHGLWPTSLKNLTQLASGEGFNKYFQDLFAGNEVSYERWKEVFDVLEIVGVGEEGGGETLEQQVLKITGSEDMEKLRALEKLCSPEFFNDPSLLVAVSRRILEVLELAMPAPVEEKKVRGKKKKGMKKKKADPRKLEVLDAYLALGRACNMVSDQEDARQYLKRAKEGYEELLGPNSEKALESTLCLLIATDSLFRAFGKSRGERIEKLRVLVGRMVGALGEENVVTLETLSQLGAKLADNGEYEEARNFFERCLEGQERVLGEDHKQIKVPIQSLLYFSFRVFVNMGS
ncbi:hypothetical protein TrVE_jg2668 [Triparma verrucosa]|uniref:Uncharacterized protein n=1 Tax=Triparma verrucosa TaxID=1606542 RepID=A0A9W7EQG8_9STRA|nr:hypothetical protein TrVE_jg2668 [Triparma verrucosa]